MSDGRPGLKQRRFRQRVSAYREVRARRPRRGIPRSAVPSFFTLMNLLAGFMAIIQVYEGNFVNAGWLIVLAGFFDALDGMMARLTNGTSLFGVELDSLSDIVSFGVAPSFLIYVFALEDFGTTGMIVAALPAICGAVRLARFNVGFDGIKKDYFTGLPIPVAAAVIVAVILNGDFVRVVLDQGSNHRIFITSVIVLSGLMISNIPFDAIPRPNAAYMKLHPLKFVAFMVGAVLLVMFREAGLLAVLLLYLAVGIGRALYQFAMAVWDADPQTNSDS